MDRGQLRCTQATIPTSRRACCRKTLIPTWEKQQDRIRHEQSYDRYKAGRTRLDCQRPSFSTGAMIEDEGLEKPLELDVVDLDLPNPPRSGDLP